MNQGPADLQSAALTTELYTHVLRGTKDFQLKKAEKTIKRQKSTAAGFEPARAEPNAFRVHLLNHSDTLSHLFFGYPESSIYYERLGRVICKKGPAEI